MGRVRVRWRGVGRVAVGAGLALVALQALPDLLRPPQAPPLAADVGLPRVGLPREPAVEIREPAGRRRRGELLPHVREGLDRPRAPEPAGNAPAATAVIGTTPRRREPGRNRAHRCERVELLSVCESNSTALPAPGPRAAPAPPPVPEPAPAPPPEAAPPPGDGSLEFAPH